jgi:hypothetical protein
MLKIILVVHQLVKRSFVDFETQQNRLSFAEMCSKCCTQKMLTKPVEVIADSINKSTEGLYTVCVKAPPPNLTFF